MTALSKISQLQGLPKTPADSRLVKSIEARVATWLIQLQDEVPYEILDLEEDQDEPKLPAQFLEPAYSEATERWAKRIGINSICLIEHIHAWREILVANSATLLPGRTNVSLREDAVRSAWKQAISNLQLPLEWRSPKLHPQKNGRRFD